MCDASVFKRLQMSLIYVTNDMNKYSIELNKLIFSR